MSKFVRLLIILPEGIFIEIMDPSRICLIRIILNDSSYKFYKEGKYALNIENLVNVLSCETNDKSKVTVQFGNTSLFITIKSEKFGSEINRTSEYLDLELEPINLEITLKQPLTKEYYQDCSTSKILYSENIQKVEEIKSIVCPICHEPMQRNASLNIQNYFELILKLFDRHFISLFYWSLLNQ